MKKIITGICVVIFCTAGAYMLTNKKNINKTIKLPRPSYASTTSIEKALTKRRSIRKYGLAPLTPSEISQLLWAAQGITNQRGFRTAPSAGATYPLELYVIVQNAVGIDKGIYRYIPQGHKIVKIKEADKVDFDKITRQGWIAESAVVFAITAVYKRTTGRYGKRGVMYVHMEAGHAAQNIQLQGTSLDIGSCVVGAFINSEVTKLLNLSSEEEPLYLIPAGKNYCKKCES
jgi:SagB-type dehydrogenase family enzyme